MSCSWPERERTRFAPTWLVAMSYRGHQASASELAVRSSCSRRWNRGEPGCLPAFVLRRASSPCATMGQSGRASRAAGSVNIQRARFGWTLSVTPGNSSAAASFQASRSYLLPVTYAGLGSTIFGISATSGARYSKCSRGCVLSVAIAIRCARSGSPSLSASAIAVSTWGEARTSRPCSRNVYQVVLIPARFASSSRRNPGVRRRGEPGRPTSDGAVRSRLARRNEPSSCRRSVVESVT